MRVINLFSGSSGNCTLVTSGGRALLIDAGGSAKAVCDALEAVGSSIELVSDIFITHEHSDHTHALEVLLKKHPCRVHMVSETANALGIREGSALFYCLVRHDGEFAFDVCGVRVEAFFVPHDSACCVGYKISEGDVSVGVVTDIGYVSQRVYDCLCGCKAVMIEANHDKEMVRKGSYPAALKRRILSGGGHLSNDECAEISAALARKGTKSLMLAHLSEENNTPRTACDAVGCSVSEYGVEVVCAKRDEPTELSLIAD